MPQSINWIKCAAGGIPPHCSTLAASLSTKAIGNDFSKSLSTDRPGFERYADRWGVSEDRESDEFPAQGRTASQTERELMTNDGRLR